MSSGSGLSFHASVWKRTAWRPSFCHRVGHIGAIGPKPTGVQRSARVLIARPAGRRFGSGTPPYASGRVSERIPTGFMVSGPPAERS